MSVSPIQKRFLLFLLLCIPARLGLTVLAKYIPLKFLPLMGIVFLIIGLSFLYLNLFNKRLTGLETGGDVIWWNDLRPVHGFLALIFGILAISKVKEAWIVLLIDTILGLVSFLAYHSINKNILKLFN
jgi:hypothetical protein